MPELPEVETVRRGLQPLMEGSRVDRLVVNRPDLRFPFPERFRERVEGQVISGLGRRAKFLLIGLDGGETLIAHLGMSGSFRIEAGPLDETTPGEFHHPRSKIEAHDHVIFELSGPNGPARIIYNDPRRFGFMRLAATADLSEHEHFRDLGPEPTGNALSPESLAKRMEGRAQPLKSALLDQHVIAGLGNIYVCEALHRAGLSPLRKSGTLVTAKGKPKAELIALEGHIRTVIAEAIEAGGSSLRDHIQTDGSLGYFQHRFHVYDREGQPCQRPGCQGTIERIVQSGRSTFYCATCQH